MCLMPERFNAESVTDIIQEVMHMVSRFGPEALDTIMNDLLAKTPMIKKAPGSTRVVPQEALEKAIKHGPSADEIAFAESHGPFHEGSAPIIHARFVHLLYNTLKYLRNSAEPGADWVASVPAGRFKSLVKAFAAREIAVAAANHRKAKKAPSSGKKVKKTLCDRLSAAFARVTTAFALFDRSPRVICAQIDMCVNIFEGIREAFAQAGQFDEEDVECFEYVIDMGRDLLCAQLIVCCVEKGSPERACKELRTIVTKVLGSEERAETLASLAHVARVRRKCQVRRSDVDMMRAIEAELIRLGAKGADDEEATRLADEIKTEFLKTEGQGDWVELMIGDMDTPDTSVSQTMLHFMNEAVSRGLMRGDSKEAKRIQKLAKSRGKAEGEYRPGDEDDALDAENEALLRELEAEGASELEEDEFEDEEDFDDGESLIESDDEEGSLTAEEREDEDDPDAMMNDE